MKQLIVILAIVVSILGTLLLLGRSRAKGSIDPTHPQIANTSEVPVTVDASVAAAIKPAAELSPEQRERLLQSNPYIPSSLEKEWERFAQEQGVQEESTVMKERLARYSEALELIGQAMQACKSDRTVGLEWIERAEREFGSYEFQKLHEEFGRAIIVVGHQRKHECESDMEEHGLAMEAELQKSAVAMQGIFGRFADKYAVAVEEKAGLAAFQTFLGRFSENPSPLSIILANSSPRPADVRVMQFVENDPAFQGLYDARKSMLIFKSHTGY